MKEKLAALERENLDCQMRRAELLVENGYTVEYLNDIYSCPDCRDTGVLNGGVCHCLDKLYNRELTKELGVLMQNGSECFERFDLNLYSYWLDPRSGVIPRDAMRIVRDAGRKFADNFPNVSSNLLFQGGPGLGKTFLSACIARRRGGEGLLRLLRFRRLRAGSLREAEVFPAIRTRRTPPPRACGACSTAT